MIKNTKIRSFMLAFGFTVLDVMLILLVLYVIESGIVLYAYYNKLHINLQLINISRICITVVCCIVIFIRLLKKYLARTEAEWQKNSYY